MKVKQKLHIIGALRAPTGFTGSDQPTWKTHLPPVHDPRSPISAQCMAVSLPL